LKKLTDAQRFKIKKMMSQNIQFVAGTTAPAESDWDSMDIESIYKAVMYYHEKFTELSQDPSNVSVNFKMIAEPKYMGSRCTLYLHRDIDKCMATSRSGIKLNADRLNLKPMFLQNMWLLDEFDADELIVDGELCPWSILGKGLIEKEFKALPVCVKAEYDFLKSTTLEDQFEKLMSSVDYLSFVADQQSLISAKELRVKYPHYETYINIQQMNFDIDLNLDVARIEKYSDQIDLYGKDSEMIFKPFNVLKSIKDGVAKLYVWENQAELYAKLTANASDLEKGIVFSVLDVTNAVDVLTDYMQKLQKAGFEGFVMKPIYNHEKLLPYMKVRNKEYLRIIYGYDYDSPKKLTYFVKKNKCNKKRRLSIVEWQLGNELLLCENNETKKEILAQLLFEIEAEKEVDCRL